MNTNEITPNNNSSNISAVNGHGQPPTVLKLSYDVKVPLSTAELNKMSKSDLIAMIQTLHMDITNCCEVIRQTDEKCHSNYEQYRKHLNIVQYSYARLQKEHSKEKSKSNKKWKQYPSFLTSVPENKTLDDKEADAQSVATTVATVIETVNKQPCMTTINNNINIVDQYQRQQQPQMNQSTIDTKDMMINKYLLELAEMKQLFNDSQSQLARVTYENIQMDCALKNNESVRESLNDRLYQVLQNENTINELNAALGESEARCAQLQDVEKYQSLKKNTKSDEIAVAKKGKKKSKKLVRVGEEENVDMEREMLNKSQHLEECIGHNMQLQAQMQASDIERKGLEKDIEQYQRSLADCRQNNVQLQTNLQQLMMQIMYNWSQFHSQTPAESQPQINGENGFQFQFVSSSNVSANAAVVN